MNWEIIPFCLDELIMPQRFSLIKLLLHRGFYIIHLILSKITHPSTITVRIILAVGASVNAIK
jgi:hypothetical protein